MIYISETFFLSEWGAKAIPAHSGTELSTDAPIHDTLL